MDPSFFARLGLFVREDFLAADDRAALLAEVRSAESANATVAGSESDAVDEGHRRSKWALVGDEARSRVGDAVDALRPELESHFGVSLGTCQKPQFLVYRPGDYFRPHRDNSDSEDTSDYARARAVSVVTFLNGEGEDDASYEGGALTFYELMGTARDGSKVGLPLSARPGLLVAFDATAIHAVSPVTRGERFTVVTWFTREPATPA